MLTKYYEPSSWDHMTYLVYYLVEVYLSRQSTDAYFKYRRGGGPGQSQYPYVGLLGSTTEFPIEIILSGMTYYHHSFEEYIKSKIIRIHFFRMKVHFCIYLMD